MRVVVLGATGNVGSTVVEVLAAEPSVDEVVGVARRRPLASAATRFVTADVARDPLDEVVAGTDVVVHLAWMFQPTHQPMVTWRGNVLGTRRVLDAVERAGVPAFVYASSIGAYSPAPAGGAPVDESWPTHSRPTAAYGREKAYVERVLDAFELEHPEVRVVRLRPAFTFQRESASSQRRIFLGPFVPDRLLRPGTLPLVPLPRGLRLQALHTTDVADAYRRAVIGDVRGAFNVAADDVLDVADLGHLLGSRPVELPRRLVRAAVAAAWHARLVPADPNLLDLALELPVMATDRARAELGWAPTRTAADAVRELLLGIADGAGGPSAPLAPDAAWRRLGEVGRGVGQRS